MGWDVGERVGGQAEQQVAKQQLARSKLPWLASVIRGMDWMDGTALCKVCNDVDKIVVSLNRACAPQLDGSPFPPPHPWLVPVPSLLSMSERGYHLGTRQKRAQNGSPRHLCRSY